jgi:2Fe-2S ferredoxin
MERSLSTMPEVIFVHPDGRRQTVTAAEGASVMQTAVAAGVAGIIGECGGSAICATCHVYVSTDWSDKLSSPLDNELEMLECTAAERRDTSRLSCQIKMTGALNGLVVCIPERQQDP